jgi:hypothetical protein
MTYADDLLTLLADSAEYPPPAEAYVRERVNLWAAFREADSDYLKPRGWGEDRSGDRQYMVDPLASRIVGAKADLIFGQDPTFTAANEGDQDQLDGLIDANDLPSQLQHAERVCASEGEVWWKAYVDTEQAPFPIIQWLSRAFVVPMFRGRTLLAAAFVSELDPLKKDEIWRLVEIHDRNTVTHHLFKAGKSAKNIGDDVDLASHPDSEGLLDVWEHGLDQLLCGRVVNDEGTDPAYGVSDYVGVRDLLYALNEATTIGVENARLTAKKRIVAPQRFLDERGEFPAGVDVIVATETDQDPDKPGQGLVQVEWEFDAQALQVWTDDLESRILTRTRTAPVLVGRGAENAQTGPALRARLIDSVLDAHGKGRYWDDELPKCLRAAQRVDALSKDEHGLGNQWTAPDEPPAIERTLPLPEDETEQANRIAVEVGAELKSRKTAIEELHPDWTEEQVSAELKLIAEDNPLPVLPAPAA